MATQLLREEAVDDLPVRHALALRLPNATTIIVPASLEGDIECASYGVGLRFVGADKQRKLFCTLKHAENDHSDRGSQFASQVFQKRLEVTRAAFDKWLRRKPLAKQAD